MKTYDFERILACIKRFSMNWELGESTEFRIAYDPVWNNVRVALPNEGKWSIARAFFEEEFCKKIIPEFCKELDKEKKFQLIIKYEPELEDIEIQKSDYIAEFFENWYP